MIIVKYDVNAYDTSKSLSRVGNYSHWIIATHASKCIKPKSIANPSFMLLNFVAVIGRSFVHILYNCNCYCNRTPLIEEKYQWRIAFSVFNAIFRRSHCRRDASHRVTMYVLSKHCYSLRALKYPTLQALPTPPPILQPHSFISPCTPIVCSLC